jgi:hypothetical protein
MTPRIVYRMESLFDDVTSRFFAFFNSNTCKNSILDSKVFIFRGLSHKEMIKREQNQKKYLVDTFFSET